MQVGYARTSTTEQEAGLAAQERDLRQAGCERVFSEMISAAATKRPRLEDAIDFVRDGDVLCITKPDRMARSVQDLLTIEGRLAAKRVTLRVLSMGGSELDTRSPTGKLMLTLLAAVAEFERALMLERQREGIAKAKGEGKYKGRAATARAQAGKVIALNGEGIGPVEIAKRLHLSRSSVQRILRQASEQTTAPS